MGYYRFRLLVADLCDVLENRTYIITTIIHNDISLPNKVDDSPHVGARFERAFG